MVLFFGKKKNFFFLFFKFKKRKKKKKKTTQTQKIHAPEGPIYQKWGQRAARGAPGALLARSHPWPRQEAAWEGRPPSGALLRLLFIPVARKPQNRSRFPNLIAEPPPPSVLL